MIMNVALSFPTILGENLGLHLFVPQIYHNFDIACYKRWMKSSGLMQK